MRGTLLAALLTLAVIALAAWFFVREPVYRLVPPDGYEASRGRTAPRDDANQCLRAIEKSLTVDAVHAAKGQYPDELDVRRFLVSHVDSEGRPMADPKMRSRTPWEANIVEGAAPGGSQRLYITALPTLFGAGHDGVPHEVAQAFVGCMMKNGYKVAEVRPASWNDWIERVGLFL